MLYLTLQERQVLVFLLSLAVLGGGIRVLVKRCAPVRSVLVAGDDFGKIDINSADEATLMEIPGVGRTLARRIIEYRRDHGSFADIRELGRVRGLSGARLEQIQAAVVARRP